MDGGKNKLFFLFPLLRKKRNQCHILSASPRLDQRRTTRLLSDIIITNTFSLSCRLRWATDEFFSWKMTTLWVSPFSRRRRHCWFIMCVSSFFLLFMWTKEIDDDAVISPHPTIDARSISLYLFFFTVLAMKRKFRFFTRLHSSWHNELGGSEKWAVLFAQSLG